MPILTLSLMWAWGCGGEVVTPPTVEAPADPFAPDDLRQPIDNMHRVGHVLRAESGLKATIRGDLEATRAELRWLADHAPTFDVPDAAAMPLQGMVTVAAEHRDADRFAQAAAAWAEIGTQCGSCHVALRASIAAPDDGGAFATHAEVAQAGIDHLWASLVSANTDHWRSGANLLQGDPMPGTRPAADIAREGVRGHAVDATVRTRDFAAIVETCAECHAKDR